MNKSMKYGKVWINRKKKVYLQKQWKFPRLPSEPKREMWFDRMQLEPYHKNIKRNTREQKKKYKVIPSWRRIPTNDRFPLTEVPRTCYENAQSYTPWWHPTPNIQNAVLSTTFLMTTKYHQLEEEQRPGPYKEDRGPIFSQYSPEQNRSIRDLLHDFQRQQCQQWQIQRRSVQRARNWRSSCSWNIIRRISRCRLN